MSPKGKKGQQSNSINYRFRDEILKKDINFSLQNIQQNSLISSNPLLLSSTHLIPIKTTKLNISHKINIPGTYSDTFQASHSSNQSFSPIRSPIRSPLKSQLPSLSPNQTNKIDVSEEERVKFLQSELLKLDAIIKEEEESLKSRLAHHKNTLAQKSRLDPIESPSNYHNKSSLISNFKWQGTFDRTSSLDYQWPQQSMPDSPLNVRANNHQYGPLTKIFDIPGAASIILGNSNKAKK